MVAPLALNCPRVSPQALRAPREHLGNEDRTTVTPAEVGVRGALRFARGGAQQLVRSSWCASAYSPEAAEVRGRFPGEQRGRRDGEPPRICPDILESSDPADAGQRSEKDRHLLLVIQSRSDPRGLPTSPTG